MDAIKLIAVGIGGYLLWNWYESSLAPASSVAATTVPTSTSIAPTPIASTAAASVIAPTALPSAAQLQAQAGGANNYNIDQWNFIYNALTGRPINWDYSTLGVADRSTTMTAANYLSLLASKGLSGGSNLGMLIDIVNLYQNKSGKAKGFGTREFEAVLKGGLGMIVNDPANSAAYIDEGPMTLASAFAGSQDGTTTDFYLAVQGQGS